MIEDILTLQNMVKKRDVIIKELKEKQPQVIVETVKEDNLGLYQKEITRLEKQLEGFNELQKVRSEELTEIVGLEETISKLTKQLDQECNSNAELEDKIADAPITFPEEVVNKLIDQKNVLEEKLALCDKYYKFERERNVKIIDALIELEHEMKITKEAHELE